MNDEEIREKLSPNSSPSNRGFKIAIVVLVIAVCIGFGWAFSSHHNVEQLASSRDELQASLSQTRSQVDALSAKLNAVATASAAAQAPQETSAEQAAPERAEKVEKKAPRPPTRHVARRRAVEDPRWRQVQTELAQQQQQLAEHQKELQETQENLEKARTELQGNLDSTRNELNGSIAKNHDELVALEKKGMRSYYEFDLTKSKTFHHEGPVSISLRKANAKHGFCDLTMLVNDAELTRKHVNLYEPIMFRPEGFSGPVEIVINNIERDQVHGYVSEPKYKPSELATKSPAPQPAGAQANANPPAAAASTADVSLQHRDQ